MVSSNYPPGVTGNEPQISGWPEIPSPIPTSQMKNPEDVRCFLTHLRESEGDEEHQHRVEDDMYQCLVEKLAKSKAKDFAVLRLMAREMLKSREIDFPRWCG